MQLAAHEVHDLNELTLSCVNSITNMAFFIGKVKDPELKSLLQKHFPYHIKVGQKRVLPAGGSHSPNSWHNGKHVSHRGAFRIIDVTTRKPRILNGCTRLKARGSILSFISGLSQ